LTQAKYNFSRAKKRLTLAWSGALAVHLCLFTFGLLVVQKISIPSNENRAIVLTLESTPEDGISQNESTQIDTINDAKLGAQSGLQSTEKSGEMSQQTSAPFAKPTFEINPELKPEPLPDLEFAGANEEIPNPQRSVKIVESPSTTPRLPIESIAETFAAPEESDLVVADSGLIEINDAQEVVEEIAAEFVQLPNDQHRMVQKKIQKWIANIDDFEVVDDTFSWQHKGQTYTAVFSHLPATSDMEHDEIIVEVRTVQNGKALQTQMRLKKLAFSNFAQFIHRWDPNVQMHNDEMDGRFHSNSQILVDFDRKTRPIFHGKVTTASYRVNYEQFARRDTRQDIFRGGLETGVKKIHMRRPQMEFLGTVNNAGAKSLTFDENTRIDFDPAGGMTWTRLDSNDGEDSPTSGQFRWSDAPVYLLAAKGVTLYVSGEVKGKVMVYSPTRIVIEGDLTVNSLEANDVLGLVSGKDVVIANQTSTGAGDLHINASIYARRRFVVRDFSKPRTGTLRILGSVSAGSVSATQPRYATKISFDKRFENIRPPGFPTTDKYEIASANTDWSIIDAAIVPD
jgi:hypothetical protein